MAIPIGPLKDLIPIYRKAWREAGHPGDGEVMIAFHMFCHEDAKTGARNPAPAVRGLFRRAVRSRRRVDARHGVEGLQGYDDSIGRMKNFTLESQIEARGAWSARPTRSRTSSAAFRTRSASSSTPRCRSISARSTSPRRRNRCGCSRAK